jgi:hypothetical protein
MDRKSGGGQKEILSTRVCIMHLEGQIQTDCCLLYLFTRETAKH